MQPCGCKEDQSGLCSIGEELTTQSSSAFQTYMCYQRTHEKVGVTRDTLEKKYNDFLQKQKKLIEHITGGNNDTAS